MHLFYLLPQCLFINLVFLCFCSITLLILLGNHVCFFLSSNNAYRRTNIFISCATNYYMDISTLIFQNITNPCEKLKTLPLPPCALTKDFPFLVNGIYILLFHKLKTSQNILNVYHFLQLMSNQTTMITAVRFLVEPDHLYFHCHSFSLRINNSL